MCVAICLFPFTEVKAQEIDKEKIAAMNELFELTGITKVAETMGVQTAALTVEAMRKVNPELNQKMVNIINEEIALFFKEKMNDGSFLPIYYPIYDKYYTTDELKELVVFYKTPLGQKSISILPSIMQDSMDAGKKWGESISPELQTRMKVRFEKENPDKK